MMPAMPHVDRLLALNAHRGNALQPAPPEAIARLKSLRLPDALVHVYEKMNGGGGEGAHLFRADRVTRNGDTVDSTSVRGQVVFGDNGKSLAARQIYTCDVSDFFGFGRGAIIRGTVKLKWGWAQLVAPSAEEFLEALGERAPKGTFIAKTARKSLHRALTRHSNRVKSTPGDEHVDPDRSSRNLRDDGRTEIPWCLTHLYAVVGKLEVESLRVRPFLELEDTPDTGLPDFVKGYFFAEDADARYVVSRGRASFPEGLVLRVPKKSPHDATVGGHLLDVVTRWVEGAPTPQRTWPEWADTIG
jgi:hypothetical protein